MNAKPVFHWGVCFLLIFVGSISPAHRQKALAKPLADQFTSCAAQTQIPETECAALLTFFDSTNGEDWTDNTGWLQTDTPCSWHGIHCNAESHVDGLDLTSNHLTGTLTSALGNLTHLVILDLRINQISGSIPPELGNLPDLTWLTLRDNLLTGSIPPELGNLAKLDTLYLISNQLSG